MHRADGSALHHPSGARTRCMHTLVTTRTRTPHACLHRTGSPGCGAAKQLIFFTLATSSAVIICPKRARHAARHANSYSHGTLSILQQRAWRLIISLARRLVVGITNTITKHTCDTCQREAHTRKRGAHSALNSQPIDIKPDAVSRYLVRPELPRGHVGAADGRGPSARTVRRVERAGERSRITQRLLESLRHPYTESQVYFVFYWYYTRTCSAYGGVRHTTALRLRDAHQRTFASDSWSTSVDAHASQLRTR